jgi:hypothetical protein
VGGGGGRQNTCIQGGVVGGAEIRHPVRDQGGRGQRHCGEGASEGLRVPPISLGPPHGQGQRPPGVVEDPIEAGEEPRMPPEVHRQRRPTERQWGKGSRHPRMARGTCEGCQSMGCIRMATENHPKRHHGRPTGHRHCARPCDRVPKASSLSWSSRGRRGWSAMNRNPPRSRRGQPEVRCRAAWQERWL